jgi:hypothetical protein
VSRHPQQVHVADDGWTLLRMSVHRVDGESSERERDEGRVSDLWESNPGIGEAFSARLASAARMVWRRGLNRIMYRRQRGIMAGALMVRATTLAGAVPTR